MLIKEVDLFLTVKEWINNQDTINTACPAI